MNFDRRDAPFENCFLKFRRDRHSFGQKQQSLIVVDGKMELAADDQIIAVHRDVDRRMPTICSAEMGIGFSSVLHSR